MTKPTKQKRRAVPPIFPVLVGGQTYPTDEICPQCHVAKVLGYHRPTAMLHGGAMTVTNAKTKSTWIAEDGVAFLDFIWWNDRSGVLTKMNIASDAPLGQFEFYFCSTKCLRAFLNAAVDAFERKVNMMIRSRVAAVKRK